MCIVFWLWWQTNVCQLTKHIFHSLFLLLPLIPNTGTGKIQYPVSQVHNSNISTWFMNQLFMLAFATQHCFFATKTRSKLALLCVHGNFGNRVSTPSLKRWLVTVDNVKRKGEDGLGQFEPATLTGRVLKLMGAFDYMPLLLPPWWNLPCSIQTQEK